MEAMTRRLCVLAVAMLAGAAGPAAEPARSSATIEPLAGQTLRGWGMALTWEANLIYGSPLLEPRLKDPAEQARYMDLLYGDPAQRPTLGLNTARYNIGGGDNPDRARCMRPPKHGLLPQAQIEGFLTGPGGGYDWTRDASQRRMLQEAKARGAVIFEAFSNSAPWWMTVSGCVSGAEQPAADNLREDAVPAFASYLAAVARHFRTAEGIGFGSVSPLNEPDGTWWVLGNDQEGSYATLPMQAAVIRALARDLAGTGMVVSGTEPNNLDHMADILAGLDAQALAGLGQINVHEYNGGNPGALRERVAALHKPLWASEVGCCFEPDRSEISGALTMAASIQTALRDLGAAVWCFWQTDWGVIDTAAGGLRLQKQYYAIAQYTRFIRPGFTVLDGPPSNTTAALSADGRRLVLVAINVGDGAALEDFDLSRLHRAGAAVRVYRTSAEAAVNLAPATGAVGADGHLIDRQPGSSVTTYVIDGPPVSVRPAGRGPG